LRTVRLNDCAIIPASSDTAADEGDDQGEESDAADDGTDDGRRSEVRIGVGIGVIGAGTASGRTAAVQAIGIATCITTISEVTVLCFRSCAKREDDNDDQVESFTS